MRELSIGIIFLGSENYYAEEFNVINSSLGGLRTLLENKAAKVYSTNTLVLTEKSMLADVDYLQNQNIDILILQCSSFFDGSLIKHLNKFNIPMFVWAIEEQVKENDIKLHSVLSMLVAGSIAHHLFNENSITDWFYGNANSEEFSSKFIPYINALIAVKNLKNSTIGLVGKTADGFINMEFGHNDIVKKFNLKTISFSENEIIAIAKNINNTEVDIYIEKYKYLLCTRDRLSESFNKNIRLFLALKKIIDQYSLDALAVSCWPTFQTDYNIVPCFALTLVNDLLNIPVSCEGDFHGVLTMLMFKYLTNNKSMVFDIADIIIKKKMLLLWHCGIMTESLVNYKDSKLINHPMLNRKLGPEKRLGCSFDGVFINQTVTASRLLNTNDKLFSLVGDVVENDQSGFSGTRGWITNIVNKEKLITIDEIIDIIIKNGVEHHLAVVPGDWSVELKCLSKLLKLEEI